jgi:branched-chain amino acid transport system permease protein
MRRSEAAMWAYIVNLLVLISINAILAVTLNFILGYAGIFSMAHALFFGVGAYGATFAAMKLGLGFVSATAFGMLLAALISLALALPALRVRGEYFVAASLGLQMLAITVFTEWKSVTGGIGGLTNIPPASILGFKFTEPEHYLALSLGSLVAIILIIRGLVRSSFGRSLKALRDDETAASAFGKNVAVIKTTAVVLSSALAAIAGALYASYLSFINVESFVLDTSIQTMAMVIIGGTATLFGPVIGAVLILLLPAGLSYIPHLPATEVGSIQQIIYGLAMVLLMVFRPGGLWGFQDQPKGEA